MGLMRLKAAVGLFAGWKGYAVAAIAAGALAGAGAWTAQGWRYGAQIAGIERDQAKGASLQAQATIAQLLSDIDAIASAGRRAAAVGPALTSEINKITGALKDATSLPDDCRPDPIRVRSLTDSVRAANRAAAGQPIGGAMPSDP
jgi:hypothetical protein